jgi:uncharacterized membrane protein YccC
VIKQEGKEKHKYVKRNSYGTAAARNWLTHSARTALAVVASLIVARLCRMPEAYWAPITTIFALGLLCALLRLDQSAYRFAGFTLTIVVLIVRPQAPWTTGLHRFVEVSLGIAVALVFTAVWPPRDLPSAKNAHKSWDRATATRGSSLTPESQGSATPLELVLQVPPLCWTISTLLHLRAGVTELSLVPPVTRG